MKYPVYNTKWVKIKEELPKIGVECPNCHSTATEDNSFMGKDGKHWISVKCDGCRSKWIVSQGKPGGAKKEEEVANQILLDRIDVLEDKVHKHGEVLRKLASK